MHVFGLILFFVWNSTAISDDVITKQLKLKWSSIYTYSVLYPGDFKDTISEPVKTWQPIIEFYLYGRNFHPLKNCLVYFIPENNNNNGVLKIIESPIDKSCREMILSPGIFEYKNIFNFGIKLDKHKIQLSIDQKDININLNLKESALDLAWSDNIGRKVSLSDDESCFRINDQCEIIQKDICQFCENGARSYVGAACAKSYNKLCGIKKCGLKGEFACIRGFSQVIKPSQYCVNDSPVGFCRDGSRVICVNNNLICR